MQIINNQNIYSGIKTGIFINDRCRKLYIFIEYNGSMLDAINYGFNELIFNENSIGFK